MTVNEGKRGKGRPSAYKDEYVDLARKYCLLGATDEDLAKFFEVSVTTIDNWKNEHSDFLGAIKEGKDQADARVAHSLYNQAIGYKSKKVVTATHMGRITDEKEIDEYIGPSATAAIFWLKNRQKDKWRDKQEIDHRTPDGMQVQVSQVSDEELKERMAELGLGRVVGQLVGKVADK